MTPWPALVRATVDSGAGLPVLGPMRSKRRMNFSSSIPARGWTVSRSMLVICARMGDCRSCPRRKREGNISESFILHVLRVGVNQRVHGFEAEPAKRDLVKGARQPVEL